MPTPIIPDYAKAYACGRHAAEEHVSPAENPYRRGSASFHAWNDGHYDARSVRSLAIEKHSALLWN